MTRSFDLDARTALAELQRAMEEFRSNDLDDALARNVAVKAWHLGDHAFKALGTRSGFDSLPQFQNHVRDECPELAWLQDVCIETKHGEITRYPPRIHAARLHRGSFSRGFSRGFDVSRLEISFPDGQKVWFIDAAERALEFWWRFLEDNGLN